MQFVKNPPIDAARIVEFIARKGAQARLAGADKLRVAQKMPEWQERARAVLRILEELGK